MELLKRLINEIGPSGDEAKVRNIISKTIKPWVNEIYTDSMGNLICHKKGKGEKIMLAAHMDEVALMVKQIQNNGLLKFSPIGGIAAITLIGQTVYVLKKDNQIACEGIISFPRIHEGAAVYDLPSMDELYVDTGLSKKDVQKLGINVGSYIVPSQQFTTLGNKKIISGKALDDRIGCYILIELAKRIKKINHDVYYVFTVQEEIGLYGAKTSVYNIHPHWGIAIDVTEARDAEIRAECVLGSGPFLTMMDKEMIANKCLNDWIENIAKKEKIPLQLDVSEHGTTDATSIMLSRGGIPSTTLSVAVRNIHSTVGMSHFDDIKNAIELLYRLLKKPPKICLV